MSGSNANPSSAEVQAVSAAALDNSIGVNTDLSWLDSSYVNGALVLSELQYLGVHNVRDGVNASVSQAESLMAAGIKFDLGGDLPVPTMIADLNAFEAAEPGGIIAVEGINESQIPDLSATLTHQQSLYAAVEADPALSGVSVYNYTEFSFQSSDFTLKGNVSSSATTGNTHSYSAYLPPELWNSWFIPLGLQATPGLPYVVTETGYNTASATINGAMSQGENQDVQAKYTLDTIFDNLKAGVQLTYLYQLMDPFNDPTNTIGEDNFGLFNADGTPKEAASALHNLTTILSDGSATASSFVPGSLAYSVEGLDSQIDPSALQSAFTDGILTNSYVATLPVYGNSMLFEKSNGSFDIAVWQEPELWDAATSSEINAASTPVTVTLVKEAAFVEVFDPLVGTSPIASYSDVSQVSVNVTASPIIIEVDPFKTIAITETATSLKTTDASTITPFTGVVIGDPNDGQTETVTITLSSLADGMLIDPAAGKDGSSSTGGVWSDTGSAAGVAAAMDGLMFTPTNHQVMPGQSVTTVLTATVTDTAGQSATTTSTVNVTAMASPISMTGNMPSFATTDAVPITPFSGLAIADANAGQTETVTVTLSSLANGTLTDPTAPKDGSSLSNGIWTDTGSAASVAAALGGLVFTPTVHQVAAGQNVTTTLTATLIDTAGQTDSTAVNVTVTALAQTVSPAISINPATIPASTGPVVIGSGNDSIGLSISEDYYLANAQFLLMVDGVQIGGVQTATAQQSLGQSEAFSVDGNFGAGPHTVAIEFLNDAYAGTPTTDRNLYVRGASYDGVAAPGSQLSLMSDGVQSFTVGTTVPGPTVIGTGSQSITFNAFEQAFEDNAQFTIDVDGVQIGGKQTVSAIGLIGETQQFTVDGNFSSGSHIVSFNFVNPDGIAGYQAAQRTLTITNVSANGTNLSNTALTFSDNTPQTLSFSANPTAPVTIGSGSDSIGLSISEDYYLSNAQFTVSVDGKQIGGVQTATAQQSLGQAQPFTVEGSFGAGPHTVSIAFLNDDYAGSPTADRNLYVQGASYDGVAAPSSQLALMSDGVQSFTVGDAVPRSTVIGTGSQSVTFEASEQAFEGDSHFTVSVDGTQVGGVQTVSAIGAIGETQQFTVDSNLSAGAHTISFDLVNPAGVAGYEAAERSLTIDTVAVNGTTLSNNPMTFLNSTPQSLSFNVAPSTLPPTVVGSGPDTLSLALTEDNSAGNANFFLVIDGKQYGGMQTATAARDAGHTQVFQVEDQLSGNHTFGIDMLNAAPGTGLFLLGANIDGAGISNSVLNFTSNGIQTVSFHH